MKLHEDWSISQRDGGDRFINSVSAPLTDEEKENMKKEIIENHEKLGLEDKLKYEIYPELFGQNPESIWIIIALQCFEYFKRKVSIQTFLKLLNFLFL